LSGFGVVLAFAIASGATVGSKSGGSFGSPEAVSLVVTLVGVLLLGWLREPRGLSRDAVIGITYVLASALCIAMASRLPQESHEIDDVLFGNAVAVERDRMWLAAAVSVALLALHALLFRPFLLAAHDPHTATAHGVPVRALDAVLFLSMGLAISIATRTIGALPVFAFTLLPPAAGLLAFNDIRAALISSAIGAALAAFVGYWISFVFDLPTGACTAILCAALLLPAGIRRATRRI
jgi:zinc transport system permease protein